MGTCVSSHTVPDASLFQNSSPGSLHSFQPAPFKHICGSLISPVCSGIGTICGLRQIRSSLISLIPYHGDGLRFSATGLFFPVFYLVQHL